MQNNKVDIEKLLTYAVMHEIDPDYKRYQNYFENEHLLLLSQIGNMSPKGILHKMIMTKREMILKQHTAPIIFLENKARWYTRLPNSKTIMLKRKEDLEDRVIEYYLTLQHASDCTLTNIFSDFIEYRSLHKSECTVADDRYNFEKYIAPYHISEKEISKITRQEFKMWAVKIVSDYQMTKKYFGNVRSTLNKLISYAVDCDYIATNHLKEVSLLDDLESLYSAPLEHELREDALDCTEISSLTVIARRDAEANHKPEALGIVLLLLTGLRIGELCALRYSDFDRFHLQLRLSRMQRDKYINVNGKRKREGYEIVPWLKMGNKNKPKHRTIKISGEVIDLIDRIKEINQSLAYPVEDTDYIFWRKNKETKFQLDMCNHRVFDALLRNYCKKCNFQYVYSPHDLRRTYASNLYLNGVSLEMIRRQLGHTTTEMTMKYIRDVIEPEIEDEHFLSAINVLNGNVSKSQQTFDIKSKTAEAS